jgi:hypothetical protein
MPVDKPKAGETKDEYLAYCIPAEINAGYEKEQAAAICISTYDRQELSKQKFGKASDRVASKLVFERKYEGINLTALAEDGLEGACWDGYEAIGTKILDGREVPNCVSIKES